MSWEFMSPERIKEAEIAWKQVAMKKTKVMPFVGHPFKHWDRMMNKKIIRNLEDPYPYEIIGEF